MNATTTIEPIAELSTFAEIASATTDLGNFEDIPEKHMVLKIWSGARISRSYAKSGFYRGFWVYDLYVPELGFSVACNAITPRHAWKAALNHARYRELAPAYPGGEERETFSSKKKA